MMVEVYVSDDGDVIHKEYEGDPLIVKMQRLKYPLPVWSADITPEEIANSPLEIEPVLYYKTSLRIEAVDQWSNPEASQRRAEKLVERLAGENSGGRAGTA